MNDWNIQLRSHVCGGCVTAFADKQVYHTLLFNEKHELTRLDVCDACWQSQFRHGVTERKGFVSYWQGVYEVPPATPVDPIQKENAETLLRRLIERNDPKYMAAAYILAVMLERKRILKVKEQFQREGGRVFVYEQGKTGDVFTVPDPNLQLNQLEQVQHDVAALLEHGLPGDTPPAAPAPPTDPGVDVPEPAVAETTSETARA